jgi:pyruvate/2-oxoglutarate dehydrogenase complex dihydrolipoamide dehydrogenase (E3) component
MERATPVTTELAGKTALITGAGQGRRFVRGRATVTGNRTVVVGGQQFRASLGPVLATGTQPAVPRSTGWLAPPLDQS